MAESPSRPPSIPDLELYRTLAEESLGLMCIHDLDGVLQWVNRAAADSLGFEVEFGVGRNLRDFLSVSARPLFDQYLARIRASRADSGLMRLLAREGRERIWFYRNVLSPDGLRVLGHGLDVTERAAAEQELRESNERFRSLFEEAPIAYVEIDPSGAIRRVNRAAAEILGEPGLTGRILWQLVAPAERAVAAAEFREALGGSTQSYRALHRFEPASGVSRSLEMHLNLIPDRRRRIAGARCALLDMTQRLHAEEQVRLINAELEARVAERTAELLRSTADLRQFAYVVSHDLQTPLRQLRSLLDGIAAGLPGDAATGELVNRGRAGVERMSRLTARLLEYGLAVNAPARAARNVGLAGVIAESLANLETDIRESGARVEIGTMPSVTADPASLAQVFQNLIGNAIKYRRGEPSRIRIEAARRESEWLISVADNGMGIAPTDLETVFLPFSRLHGTEYPGAGVGLAICQRVIERNGGRIWVESKAGEGSVFCFTLPA